MSDQAQRQKKKRKSRGWIKTVLQIQDIVLISIKVLECVNNLKKPL